MGLRIYNKNKILTIDNHYRGVALRRIINAKDLPGADSITCYTDPVNSWQLGVFKAKTISITGDEFRTFAIGPLDKLNKQKIQIVKKENGTMCIVYQNDADLEGVKLYTYGYNFPYKSGKCGLRVYNGKEQLTFDSNQKQMLIESSVVGYVNTQSCFLRDNNLGKKAVSICADINILGVDGKPFAAQIQYYLYIAAGGTSLLAAWPSGLTASAIRNVNVVHMIVDTNYL